MNYSEAAKTLRSYYYDLYNEVINLPESVIKDLQIKAMTLAISKWMTPEELLEYIIIDDSKTWLNTFRCYFLVRYDEYRRKYGYISLAQYMALADIVVEYIECFEVPNTVSDVELLEDDLEYYYNEYYTDDLLKNEKQHIKVREDMKKEKLDYIDFHTTNR